MRLPPWFGTGRFTPIAFLESSTSPWILVMMFSTIRFVTDIIWYEEITQTPSPRVRVDQPEPTLESKIPGPMTVEARLSPYHNLHPALKGFFDPLRVGNSYAEPSTAYVLLPENHPGSPIRMHKEIRWGLERVPLWVFRFLLLVLNVLNSEVRRPAPPPHSVPSLLLMFPVRITGS